MQVNSLDKKCVVSGNAPSLKEIDYKRLPLSYDLFRCNQFYLEDKYYLGSKIKVTAFATQMFFEQIYTMFQLTQKQEYDVESIFLHRHHIIPQSKREFELEFLAKIFNHDAFIKQTDNCKDMGAFLDFMKIQDIYFDKHPTTAVLLCGIAAAMWYREIYLAGIDFYEGKTYAFDTLKQNIVSLMPDFPHIIKTELKPRDTPGYHSRQTDLETLEFLSKHYNVSFYCLCPNSPMAKYFPLAPVTNNTFIQNEKPKDCIQDVLIPPKYMRDKLLDTHTKQVESRRNRIKRNIYFRIFSDFLRLPSDILYYFRHSRKG